MTAFGALEWLARLGFLVKGLLYVIVGVLAFEVAFTAGGRVISTRDALTTFLGEPFGRQFLLVAAIGLLGYAVWRILQGVFDPDRRGRDWRGRVVRTGFVLRGLVYAAVGWQAFRLHRGLRASDGDTEREVIAEFMEWPLGDWLVVLAGLGLVAFAVHQAYNAVRCRLERNLDVASMRREAGEWAVGFSRFGVAARAVVLALLGWTVVSAGFTENPSEVDGTASSLRTLAGLPGDLGVWLLGVTAAGLIAYGGYEILHARYLRIRPIE
ncbi:MAG: DUF1206 domain-containing protein [Vicinamibacteraceae bacterium]|nr:DUF1206 domain-containing protein [Vicinamibacteraceae bacterium]